MPTRRRSAAPLVAIASLLATLSSARAIAAPLPLQADVRVGSPIDIAAFERFVARRYHIQFRTILAADIDRDGDVDLVAATDRGFVVWVNDGEGHLTSQPTAQAPSVDGSAGGTAWRGRAGAVPETIQNTLPSVPLPGVYAHAPPRLVAANCSRSPASARCPSAFGCRTPRAPPV